MHTQANFRIVEVQPKHVAIAEKRDPAFEAVYKSPGVRTLRRTL